MVAPGEKHDAESAVRPERPTAAPLGAPVNAIRPA